MTRRETRGSDEREGCSERSRSAISMRRSSVEVSGRGGKREKGGREGATRWKGGKEGVNERLREGRECEMRRARGWRGGADHG